jgi:DNA (cytosine-5)-methyltransferase 1
MITTSELHQQDIRTLRLARGIGQKELAIRANVPLVELSKCERGLTVPNLAFFQSIGQILSASPGELLEAHLKLNETAIPGEGYTTAASGGSFILERKVQPKSGLISVMDLFCGTGGFSHGFEQTGHFQVTLGLDLLPDRIRTFSANHETATVICGDIREVSTCSIIEASPRPDIIIGGPPCQGFSSLRPFRALTEKDPRNNLVEDYALFVATLRPRWFVIENVVGILTHQNGRTLRAIIELFRSIGYSTDWKVLNAALYGLPQRRERLVIVGNSIAKPFSWPAPTHYFNGRSMAGKQYGQSAHQLPLFGEVLPSAVTVMEAIHDLPELNAGEASSHYRDDVVPTEYESIMRGAAQQLTLHEATAHSDRMLDIIKQAGHNRSALPEGVTSSGFSSSYSRLEPDVPSVTLTVNFVHPASNKCIHPYQDRALTPREGARLQGFEDSYMFVGNRSQVVKQIGNAVPPLLGTVIAQALLDHI